MSATSKSSVTRGKRTALPKASDLAQDIREGKTMDDLVIIYGVSRSTLANHFARSGYSSLTGLPKGAHAHKAERSRLIESAGGSGTHVGGGDNSCGLPILPVVHTSARARFQGLDWDAIRQAYEAAGGR